MATLLLWWRHTDAPFDEQVWAKMVDVAKEFSPHHADAALSATGERFRAIALRSFASEPTPLRRLSNGSLVLSSLRYQASESELLAPPRTEAAAIIRLDPAAEQLTLSRDALGQRLLLWTRIEGGVLVATREEILLAHPAVSRRLNLAFFAARAAFVQGDDEGTALQSISALEPGARLQICARRERKDLHLPTPDPWVAGKSERQLIDRFRELLQSALEHALSNAQRPMLTLSSGFDSSALAALWHRGGRPGGSLRAVNYGYQYPGEIDERPFARELSQRLGLDLSQIDAARYPPTLEYAPGALQLNLPEFDCYWLLNQRVVEIAREAGTDVMINGSYADHMGYGAFRWCIDACKQGRIDIVVGGYFKLLTHKGIGAAWSDPGWRVLLKSLNPLRRERIWPPPAWLLPQWRDSIADQAVRRLALFKDWPDPQRAIFHLRSPHSDQDGLFNSVMERQGLDPRHPFRDYDLLRFLLALPTQMLARPLQNKWIAKQALSGVLPQDWIKPTKRGMLGPVLLRECANVWPRIVDRLTTGPTQWQLVADREQVLSSLKTTQFPGWFEPAMRTYLLQQWLAATPSLQMPPATP